MGDFLQPVGNGPHHNIAAQSWRVGPKQSPPFQTQVCDAELSQDREAIDTWLALSGALAAALAPISGPFVATELFPNSQVGATQSNDARKKTCQHGNPPNNLDTPGIAGQGLVT